MPARRSSAVRRAVLVITMAFGYSCSSDKPEFERFPVAPPGPPPPPSSQIAGAPPGWTWGGLNAGQYETGRDTGVFRSGSASGYVRSVSTQTSENSFIHVSQVLRGDLVRGKRVRFSGYLRASDVTGFGFGLWLRADAIDRVRAFDNMTGRTFTGSQHWTYAEIVVDIPDDVIGMSIGGLFSGTGTGWLDDLRFEVVGPETSVTAPIWDGPPTVTDTAAARAFFNRYGAAEPVNLDFEGFSVTEQAAIVDWVRSNSVTFATDDPVASDDDLELLRQMIGNARVVGLGEGTHGTREFFRMKHRVFQYLVRNLGFDHFSIEGSLPEAMAVDRYVQTGTGDPEALVRGMHFWTWSTEEVYDLVRWMRAWNASGAQPRLTFSGFDMQYARVAIDSLSAFAEIIDAAAGDSILAAYNCLGPIRSISNEGVWDDEYRKLSAVAQFACQQAFSRVDSLFARRLGEWSLAYGEDRTRLMQRLARVVSQWEAYSRYTADASRLRDLYMAENAAWWRSRTSSAGMVLWAHNAHVTRQQSRMGAELAAKFGAQYLNVALTFSTGTLNAFRSTLGVVTGNLQVLSVSGAWAGSIEALFDGIGRPRLIFDARAIPSGGPIAALHNRLTIRLIGASYDPDRPALVQATLVLPDDYDLVIWFRNASASRLSLGSVSEFQAMARPD